jgi:hypothetical protein
MDEVYETSLTAEHWTDGQGNRLPVGPMDVEEEELLDPESLKAVDPEEEFEGYTGNAGMTLDRWYRHAAVFLWPDRRHFDVLCDAGSRSAAAALGLRVKQWRQSGKKGAAALRAECVEFAAAIIARWEVNPFAGRFAGEERPDDLLRTLAALDAPGLIKAYLRDVMTKDASADPGKSLVGVLQKHGWGTFQQELEVLFKSATAETVERSVRLLEHVASAKPRKKGGWAELCAALAGATLRALEGIDQENPSFDYRARQVNRAEVLAGLARSLLVTEQSALLSRVVAHTLARQEEYPLTSAHVSALTALEPWLRKNVKKPCPGLSHWIASCCGQLESLTARAPRAPTDFRRPAVISCKCEDCGELRRFLDDPHEQVHRFPVREDRRRHLHHIIDRHHCDLDHKTERRGSPYTLVCTKNTRSYQERVKKFHQDQEHLAALRSIQASLPQ